MKTFLIKTQTLENYGAHDKDGRFINGNAYWKLKGGNDYIVTGLDRVQDAVAYVAARGANTVSFKEFPLEWSEVPSDYQTDYEKSQLEYEGQIIYPAERINVQAELDAKRAVLYGASAGRAEVIAEPGFETAKEIILNAIKKHDAVHGTTVERPRLDHDHGSPYDRGHADSYYRRSPNPHGYEGSTAVSPMLTKLYPEEVAAYTQGYNDNEASGDFKDYGWGSHSY